MAASFPSRLLILLAAAAAVVAAPPPIVATHTPPGDVGLGSRPARKEETKTEAEKTTRGRGPLSPPRRRSLEENGDVEGRWYESDAAAFGGGPSPADLAAQSLSFERCHTFGVPPPEGDVCRECEACGGAFAVFEASDAGGGEGRRRRRAEDPGADDVARCRRMCERCPESVERAPPTKRFVEFDLCPTDSPLSPGSERDEYPEYENANESEGGICDACARVCDEDEPRASEMDEVVDEAHEEHEDETEEWEEAEAVDILHNSSNHRNSSSHSGGSNANGSNGHNNNNSREEWPRLCRDCLVANCHGASWDPSVLGKPGCRRRILPLQDYLEIYAEFFMERQEAQCAECERRCGGGGIVDAEHEEEEEITTANNTNEEEEVGVDCYDCMDTCYKIENMEEYGYIDATEFLECQMIYDPDDGSLPLYAGPICADAGRKIKIGVFLDEDCVRLDPRRDVEDYLVDGDGYGYALKLSHALLKRTYAAGAATSCLPDEDDDAGLRRRRRLDEDPAEPPEIKPVCQDLYEVSAPAPRPSVVASGPVSGGDGGEEAPAVVLRAGAGVEAARPDGTPLPEPEVELFWSPGEGGEGRVRVLEDEAEDNADDAMEAEDVDENREGGDGAVVQFFFGPFGQGGAEGGWALRKSALSTGEGAGEWTAGGASAIGLAGTADAAFFHCELVEFNYRGDGGGAPGGGGAVRLRDVLLGALPLPPRPPSGGLDACGAAIYNPCEDREGTICRAVDGEVGCVGVDYDRESVVPGLSREEYLHAFVCGEGSDSGGDGGGGSGSGGGTTPPPYVDADDDWYPNEGELLPPQTPEDWGNYYVRPTKCVIEDAQEMVLFSVYRNLPGYAPCRAPVVGTYTAPVSAFVDAVLSSQSDRRWWRSLEDSPPTYAECTPVQDERAGASTSVERWVRVGCSELSREGLYLNSYADEGCSRDRTAVDVANLQIPFQTCQSCGFGQYADDDAAYYNGNSNGDDDALGDDIGYANVDDAYGDGNTNVDEHYDPWGPADVPSFRRCSDLHRYLDRPCDSRCQDALLAAPDGAAVDLYWEGPRAFLQASDVAAAVGGGDGSAYRFEDDLGRPELIESGRGGEELSRERNWAESGTERRLKFYFRTDGLGWRLGEARIYAHDGVRADWTEWVGGEQSQIRVPPGEELFFCDKVEFNFKSGTFVGHDVYIGAFLPRQYDVCSLSVHNPCQTDDGARSFCHAIDGVVSCSDIEADSSSSSSPLTARASPSRSGELHCDQPTPGGADPVTLDWRGPRSFLFAARAAAGYTDGTAVHFEDRDEREPEILSGSAGELVAREGWKDAGNLMERAMAMSFAPSFRSPDGSEADDAAFWGWTMNGTSISGNGFLDPAPLFASNSMIRVPPGKQLFRCDYVSFTLYSGPHAEHYDNYDDDDFYYNSNSNDRNDAAVFVGHDVVIGAYLAEGYDICSLEAYNPCRAEGASGGSVCRAVDGRVSCADTAAADASTAAAATARSSGAAAALPMCDGGGRPPTGGDAGGDAADPAAGSSFAPTVAPTTAPTTHDFDDIRAEPSGAPCILGTSVGRVLIGFLSLQFVSHSFW